ncbi:MAG: hypothetical protein EBE86_021835 [Hormoscilla sp. GUM202]|nr:hypothetical protein [Hormoscilla sp. GM7CHS1pb]MBO1349848.1 hypothetical protein [Hormoscilla sp. GUM202]
MNQLQLATKSSPELFCSRPRSQAPPGNAEDAIATDLLRPDDLSNFDV